MESFSKISDLFNPPEVYAQLDNPATNTGVTNGVNFFNELLPAIISIGFIIGIVLFIIIFLWGAITWITSGGEKGQTEVARSRIMSALVGLVILFVLFGILNLLNVFFGVNLTRLDIEALRIGGS